MPLCTCAVRRHLQRARAQARRAGSLHVRSQQRLGAARELFRHAASSLTAQRVTLFGMQLHQCWSQATEPGLYAGEAPWSELEDVLAESWLLRVDEHFALAQVIQRQVEQGKSAKSAAVRALTNDALNAEEVRTLSRLPALELDITGAHAAEYSAL